MQRRNKGQEIGRGGIELGWGGFELSLRRKNIGIRKIQGVEEAPITSERKGRFEEH